MNRQLTAAALAGVGCLVVASAHGATVTYLGADTTTATAWRTATVTKPATLDIQGDNIYGTDGYAVRNSTGNSAGVLESLTPGYVASITWASGLTTYGIASHAHIDNPLVPGSTMPTALWYRMTSSATPTDFVTITLGQNASFVLGVIDDTFPSIASQPWNNSGLQVTQTVGGSADSDLVAVTRVALSTPPVAHYTFFQIDGAAGDAFTVRAVNITAEGTGSWTTMAGLTFDTAPVPEPASLALAGLAGVGLLRRRRR